MEAIRVESIHGSGGMIKETGGGYPPKRESPPGAQSRRAFGESTINGADALHYGISPAFIQHVHKVKAVIIQRIRSTPTTRPQHDRAHHWRGWINRYILNGGV